MLMMPDKRVLGGSRWRGYNKGLIEGRWYWQLRHVQVTGLKSCEDNVHVMGRIRVARNANARSGPRLLVINIIDTEPTQRGGGG